MYMYIHAQVDYIQQKKANKVHILKKSPTDHTLKYARYTHKKQMDNIMFNYAFVHTETGIVHVHTNLTTKVLHKIHIETNVCFMQDF